MTNITKNSKWVRYRVAGYLTGRGLSFGTGRDKIVPTEALDLEKYSITVSPFRNESVNVCGLDLGVFSDNSFDHIFIGQEFVGTPNQKEVFRGLVSKLRIGGHLVIHIAQGFSPEEVIQLVGSYGAWKSKDCYYYDGQVVQIYKRITGQKGIRPKTLTQGPRACVVRYGALGDLIMVTPLLKKLKEDGYHVTLNITPYTYEVIRNNPNVDNIIFQEKNLIPNHDLKEYWDTWRPDYDKYINLSESIEGGLLKIEGRRDFFTSQEWRHRTCNKNYIDWTMQLAGYPGVVGQRGELHFTTAEVRTVSSYLKSFGKGKFFIIWGLGGSSFHKRYPREYIEYVVHKWTENKPNVIVFTVGDNTQQELEFSHPQVVNLAGKIPLREVFCLTSLTDLVIGPESAIINAAACFDTPKICLLSHSSKENLTKYWLNDHSLEPSKEHAPCYPCHQLHYTKESCPLTEMLNGEGKVIFTGPACSTNGISTDRLMEEMDKVYYKNSLSPEILL